MKAINEKLVELRARQAMLGVPLRYRTYMYDVHASHSHSEWDAGACPHSWAATIGSLVDSIVKKLAFLRTPCK